MIGTYFIGLFPSGIVAFLLWFGIRRLLGRWKRRDKPAGPVLRSLLRAFPLAVAFAPTVAMSPPVGDKHGLGILFTASATIPMCAFEKWPIPPMHLRNIFVAATSLLVVWGICATVFLLIALRASSGIAASGDDHI
jgi:hypothetical protein